MSNHYHLLVCTPEANLPQFMRQVNGIYTQLFNRRYGSDGTLFRGRYKAIVVQEEFYLMRVIRYIHQNPIKAGIVKKAAEYKWSSHINYIKGGKKYSWLKYADVINREWLKGRKGARAYEMFMEEEDDKELEELYRARNLGSILGDNDYKDDISEKYILSKRYLELPKEYWSIAITTNRLERYFEELKRRIKPFRRSNTQSCKRWLYALLTEI